MMPPGTMHLEFHFVSDLVIQHRLGHGRKITDNAFFRLRIPGAQNRKGLRLIGFKVRGVNDSADTNDISA